VNGGENIHDAKDHDRKLLCAVTEENKSCFFGQLIALPRSMPESNVI